LKDRIAASRSAPVFLLGGGVMGEHMRATDWSATPLGSPENWPSALKTAVSLMLGARQPVYVAWGPELTSLYNDGYLPIVGTKHPHGFAKPFADLWAEIWTEFKPIVEATLAGDAQHFVDLPIALAGRPDRPVGYFTFSYTALRGDDGKIAGFYCAATETTEKVVAERGQAAERERQRLMLSQMPGFAAMLSGPEHRFDYVNDAYIAIAGRQDFIGRTVRDVFPDLEGQGFHELLDQVYATGEAVVLRARELRLQGSKDVQFIDFVYAPIRDDAGSVTGIFVGGYEVTEAHRSAAILREFNARLERQVLERSHIGGRTWQVSPDLLGTLNPEGYFESSNPAWQTVLGWSEAEVASMSIWELLHPDDVERTRSGFNLTQQGQPAIGFPNRYRCKDGSYRWISWVGVPEGGLVYCSGRDISQEKAAEAERDRLWALSEDMLARADYTGRLSAVNPAWAQVLGWSEQELLNNPYADIIHPDDVPATLTALDEMARTGQPTRFENCIRTKSGDWKPIGWTVSPEPDGVNFIAVGRDLTDYKARERELLEAQEALRQSQKMEAVGQLTGGIAHDFNNLLGGISGSLELLEKRLAEGRLAGAERYIASAQDAARRAASLTQRLLAFSRRQTLDPKSVDVNKLVAGMEELVRRTVGPTIDVQVVAAAGLWLTRVDRSQLESSLLNLCINARDAMAPGGGRLTIETANTSLDERAARERELPPGQYVSLCVTDTGAGMTPEVMARAFDPFFTTKPIGQGTGLGLSMIYGFVRQSGGQVRIQSELGKGTTMSLYMPRYAGNADQPDVVAGQAAIDPGVGETVLVIDDEPILRMLITDVLEENGYKALEAADGPTAMKFLESDARIDLLITDVGLPGGMNGRQVADAARKQRPDLKVLFVTGYAEKAVVGDGHLAPGMEVMTKPFVVTALAQKIRDMIER